MANSTEKESTFSPRVLIVMPEQWPRALLRAALREAGYDAVGTRNLGTALRIPSDEPDRGPVRVVVVNQSALGGADDKLTELLSRHGAPTTILLSRATIVTPRGPWQRVLKRPVTIDDIVTTVGELMPLPDELRHPID